MSLGMLWKPKGLGSQDALAKLKKELDLPGRSREGIGHCGILDPFAEGWLLVGTEEATKLLNPLTSLDKVYEATIYLGATTDTLDNTVDQILPEGTVKDGMLRWMNRPQEVLEAELEEFLSHYQNLEITQIPPKYSAVKVDGKRAYNLARFEGITPELKPKQVKIYQSQHLGLRRVSDEALEWDVRVHVSTGTYIRVLAKDWGTELCHFPGHLTRLKRTQVGPFASSAGRPEEGFHPLSIEDTKSVFDIHYLTESEARRLRNNGQWQPRPHPKPILLVGPEDMGVVAWTQAESGKIGRVFKKNPLS
ncbi:hypothetical protein GW916_13535 [bacterium]|nr:hypothetical protein [bacterium]